MRGPGLSVSGVLLLIVLWGGACTGARQSAETPAPEGLAPLNYNLEQLQHFQGSRHYFDETEVDLEHGRPEPASRYQRPSGAQHYRYDETDVDLAQPRPEPPDEAPPPETPPATEPAPQEQPPTPGGDR